MTDLPTIVDNIFNDLSLELPRSRFLNLCVTNSFDEEVFSAAKEDLEKYIQCDPALNGNKNFALAFNGPYRAVLSYRISNWLWRNDHSVNGQRDAYAISQFARVISGVEIHPAAQIGRKCVIDHGYGTVIGETAIIGENCYILNGVVIGAKGIESNAKCKRHPTIGDRVQIGAFARILGNIRIGSDVTIGPLSCVTENVPDHTKICAFKNDHQAYYTNRLSEWSYEKAV